jgi:ABC-2 type transport system permease protein
MKKTMFKLFFANLKMMVRGRQALFWSLVFPLMFTIIFGFFFGGTSNTAGTVALINNSENDLAQDFQKALTDAKIVTVKTDLNESQARDQLKSSQIGAIIIVPEDFGQINATGSTTSTPKVITFGTSIPEVITSTSTISQNLQSITVVLDPANVQLNTVALGFINQFLTQANYQVSQTQPIFTITLEETTSHSLTYFDFVLMGLIGLALMNSSVQGIAITMANYREDKILKRITTTPLPAWQFIAAEVLSRLVLNVFQISLILLVGYFLFHAHFYGNILLLYLFALIGGLLFQTVGFTVASLTKTTDAAQGMAVAITVPMMFLAGVFFPMDSLPKWLFSIVQYLPLAPLLRMIRQIGLENTSPLVNPLNIIIVAGWIVICLAISVWRFRLSEE